MDALYFINQARKCRRLAKHADAETARKLRELAEEYEARASALDEAREAPGSEPVTPAE